MKPGQVHRGIRSRHARSVGDAPVLGRVGRVRKLVQEQEDGGSGRGRRGTGARLRRKVLFIWSLVLMAGTLAVVGVMMMFWLKTRRAEAGAAAVVRATGNERIVSKFVSPSEDEALDLVRRALALRKPGVVASHFHPGEATPAEVVEFLAEREAREGKVKEMKWLGSMDIEGLLLEGVLVVYSVEGAGERRERLAFLAPDDKGVWKVDFDGFARTSRPSWKDLLKGDAEQAVVRVLAAPDVYFNGPFRDESQWVCYAMTSPECKELLSEENSLLRGYCRVDSAQAKAMASIFEGEAKISRATVEIRKTKGAEFRQFEITRVLSREWVVPLTPLDEKFD